MLRRPPAAGDRRRSGWSSSRSALCRLSAADLRATTGCSPAGAAPRRRAAGSSPARPTTTSAVLRTSRHARGRSPAASAAATATRPRTPAAWCSTPPRSASIEPRPRARRGHRRRGHEPRRADALARAARLVRPGHARARATSPSAARSPPTSTARTTTSTARSAATCSRSRCCTGRRRDPRRSPRARRPSCSGPRPAAWASPASILDATSDLIPIETRCIARRHRTRCRDLDDADGADGRARRPLPLLGRLDRLHGRAARASGRGVLDAGRPRAARRAADGAARGARSASTAPTPLAVAPPCVPPGCVNRADRRARSTSSGSARRPAHARASSQTIGAFFHPLDMVDGWNRIYGRRGFLQYQFVVPFGAEDDASATRSSG